MKIVIIEDEPLVARDLQATLARVDPSAEIVAVITSVAAAKKWFSSHAVPDLILSDIQLSDGNSFDIYENMNPGCPIIFTTAFDDYAIRAFKLNSIDYLLKPIDEKELSAALAKYRSLTNENILGDQLRSLLSSWNQQGKKYKERFLALHKNTLVPVSQSEIAFFQKDELIYLNTTSGEKYISDHQTLDEVESLLDPKVFFRVNRQFIVHMQLVGRVKTTHKGLTVQLKPPSNLEIDISREKASAFKSWLES